MHLHETYLMQETSDRAGIEINFNPEIVFELVRL